MVDFLSLLFSELSGKELVAEMVYSFLLPEVEKQTMRERGEDKILPYNSYNFLEVLLLDFHYCLASMLILIPGVHNSHPCFSSSWSEASLVGSSQDHSQGD